MLVLLLIGMASVAVVMVMPKYINNNESVDWQLQRFTSLLQFAEDEAIISGKEIGLVFNKNTYRFTVYDYKTNKWLALKSEQFANEIDLPESISIEYTLLGTVWDEIDVEDEDVFIDEEYLVDIEGDDEDIKSFSPQVYIMSNGEVTPFKLFLSETDKQSGALEVSMSGMITSIEAEIQ